MKLIVAVDSNWGIGLRNALLVHIPSDMKFFRSETMGKTIIMGRKTLESFPQAQPLAGRNNIVITKDPAYQVKGAVVVHSIEEAIEESWLEKLEKIKEDGWLNFVLPFDQAASGYVIEAEDLPSKWRTVNFTWYHSAISEMEENFLFTEYLLEHCCSFTSADETKKMAYELEYILNGKTSDKENLKSTVNSLLLMREGLNLFSAWKDPVLSSQAETAATALVGWTGVYPAIKLTQFTMIAGWSFAEAIVDVRTLLSGGNIPIIKNSESWTLEFLQIEDFLDGDLFLTAKENNGLSYDDYLRLLLYAQGRSDRRYHTMDVIQLRMREKNPDFSMADCLGAVQVKASMKAAPIFYCFARNGYEISCEQSRMY